MDAGYTSESARTINKPRRSPKLRVIKMLQHSGSAFAVAGGSILASNTPMSKYGFLLLAMSSGQLLASSILANNRSLMVYAGSVFCFVDCLGIYRWLWH
jgi:hypothetical protein